eukprot:Hpha_TRINITY_DN15812_c0_g6::TRINITY_DN15812_c0_g6_i1::g.188700::m.188700
MQSKLNLRTERVVGMGLVARAQLSPAVDLRPAPTLAKTLVKSRDGGHVLGAQFEVACEVLFDALGGHRLGDDGVAPLQLPRARHLRRALLVALPDLHQNGMLRDADALDLRSRAKGAVGGHSVPEPLGEFEQLLVAEEGVALTLQHGGLDTSDTVNTLQLTGVEVRKPDRLHKSQVHALLKSGPGGLDGGVGVVKHRPVLGLREPGVSPLNLLKRLGPVDEVEIQVLKLEVLEALANCRLDVLRLVLRVPEFGGYEDVLSLDDTGLEGSLERLADLSLVLVNGGAVDVTVTDLKSCADGAANFTRRRLPRAESNRRHVLPGVQLRHLGSRGSRRNRSSSKKYRNC